MQADTATLKFMTVAVQLCLEDTVSFLSSPTAALTLVQPSLFRWLLSLVRKGYDVEVPFVAEHAVNISCALTSCKALC